MYGPVPQGVGMLLEMVKLRIAAGKRGITKVTVSGVNLVFSFENADEGSEIISTVLSEGGCEFCDKFIDRGHRISWQHLTSPQ